MDAPITPLVAAAPDSAVANLVSDFNVRLIGHFYSKLISLWFFKNLLGFNSLIAEDKPSEHPTHMVLCEFYPHVVTFFIGT